MASLTSGITYLNDIPHSGSEAFTLIQGAQLIVDTDVRRDAGAPNGMSASFGALTITDGKVIFDGTKVRWLPYVSGTGNVPAIGTIVSQSGVVSSYLLAVYPSMSAAPTATGLPMPQSGYLKFRVVTGSFQEGALSGIGASASKEDVAGWIEIVSNSTTHVIPRLGQLIATGSWFYLDDADGTIGQIVQTPNNGGGIGTRVPAVWIETEPNSDIFDIWPALSGSANGWAVQNIGAPSGASDVRQNFVSELSDGRFQISSASFFTGSYSSSVNQSGSYTPIIVSCSYSWENNVVYMQSASLQLTGHLMNNSQSVNFEFLTGDLSGTVGTYVITSSGALDFTIPISGSGIGGIVRAKPGYRIDFTAHGWGVNDIIHLTPQSGIATPGYYPVYSVIGANTYYVSAPHQATSSVLGACTVNGLFGLTLPSHGFSIGNLVYLNFISGQATSSGLYSGSGIYPIVAVPTTNTFNINYPHSSSLFTGSFEIKMQVGNVPKSGSRIRIPNILMRETSSSSAVGRTLNRVNPTIASRPAHTTTGGGYISLRNVSSTWYYGAIGQAYYFELKDSCLVDTLNLSEIGSAIDIDNSTIGMITAQDLRTLQLTSIFSGGTISNFKAERGNIPGTTDHSLEVIYCKDITFNNVRGGIIQYPRSTGRAIQISNSTNLTFNDCKILNSDFSIASSLNININNLDFCDRYIGYTNATTPYYAVRATTKCNNIVLNGLTFGYGGTIPNVHPFSGLLNLTNCDNIKFRNAGSFDNKLSGGNWRPNLYACALVYLSGGNNDNVKIQRCYLTNMRTSLYTTINSDNNMTYESVFVGPYVESAKTAYLYVDSGLNSINKGIKTGGNSVATGTAQASVYGNHFHDIFIGDYKGRLVLNMNEPTADTKQYFTMTTGSSKFNSNGGILFDSASMEGIWEDRVFRLGHTALSASVPTLTGGTINSYSIHFQLDTGSGFSGDWLSASAEILGSQSFSPDVGFKMKLKIRAVNSSSVAISYIRFDTLTTPEAQSSSLYPLDINTLTLTGIVSGSEVTITTGSDSNVLYHLENVTSTGIAKYEYSYTPNTVVDILVFHINYNPILSNIYNYTLLNSDTSIPIQQIPDNIYYNP